MYRLLTATGFPSIEKEIKTIHDCTVVASVVERNKLADAVREYSPDILIISDYLSGREHMIKLLITLHRDFPDVRIIYLVQSLSEKNTAQVDAFGALVLNGIYDIVHEDTISIELIEDIIFHPKTERSVQYLTERILGQEAEVDINKQGFRYEEVKEEVDLRLIQNMYAVSSIKPGSGKSFASVNFAAAIAKYGKGNPRVALIEADLQNLSLGTLLKVEDDKKSLKVALQAISSILQNGKVVASIDDTQIVNETILDCMIPYKHAKNLDLLVGSQLTFTDINGDYISSENFVYLVEVISRMYDVVIVDTNSSLLHLSTIPIMKRAKECYYIINLDYNNIRNNLKYREVFKTIDIIDRVHYILNESYDNSKEYEAAIGSNYEPLMFTKEVIEEKYFQLQGSIPAIPKAVFLNRLYSGIPVVLDEDVPYTEKAKQAILQIANKIYPIDPQYLKDDKEDDEFAEETKQEKKKGFAGLFSKKERR